MSDYISRKEAITQAHEIIKGYAGYKAWAIVDMLRKLPSAQPERKVGKWYEDEDVGLCRCDQCNGVNLIHTPFCPMCGAKMEEGEDNERA